MLEANHILMSHTFYMINKNLKKKTYVIYVYIQDF